MRKHVDDRRLAGAVALVARGGKVAYLESVGMQDAEHGIKMRPNTIFRIASMTKPITSVAVMMLYEEGHFRLHEPISKFIPEFKDPVVLADESSDEETVPAKRQITIHHLLTHTSGLTNFGDRRLAARYRKAGITNGITHDEDLLGDDMPKLAKLPLAHHPGEAYTYGLSYDVLGRLVEVVSGMSLDEFFRTRIFEPLGMEDTYFYLLEDKVSRLAAAYAPDSDDGLKRLTDEILGKGTMGYTVTYPYQGPKRYFSGGGGLCSTVPDYARFAQMLLNGGELDGVRLLSHKTVELMTTDHVGELRRGLGWGLGFSVKRTMKEAGELGSVGTFGWWGFWYTIFFVDPQEKMVGICMAQLHPFGGADLCAKFRPLACQAIVD
jgi:CubicO group peptidase (beta-lactamase class C family)